MISYMDVLTILLIFFIAVAAQLPPNSPAPPPIDSPGPSPLDKARKVLEQRGIEAALEPRGLVIRLPQAILFASGDDQVSAGALPTVEVIAQVIRDVPNRVSLIGHADSVPIRNRRFANNWELSAARGLRLLELLANRYAIPESRLSVSSDGSNRPLGSNETEAGRASNRRVEIVLLAE